MEKVLILLQLTLLQLNMRSVRATPPRPQATNIDYDQILGEVGGTTTSILKNEIGVPPVGILGVVQYDYKMKRTSFGQSPLAFQA
ncbi:hypothetical protein WN944_014802 [Citrus x changshan-huyou]|uniref:Uncharacterized protein n=1 Tax=Citrus x changshan-huyou TaxID=2935761 RepID=A0AAP0QM18_9ROSI